MRKYIFMGLVIFLFGGAYFVTQNYNKSTSETEPPNGSAASSITSVNENTPSPTGLEKKSKVVEQSVAVNNEKQPNNLVVSTPNKGIESSTTGNTKVQKPVNNEVPIQKSVDPSVATLTPTISNIPEPMVINTPTPEVKTPPKQNSNAQTAPDFTLLDLNGNKVSLSDFRGKNVFLNFWATWCPPCKAEMPDIEKVYQKYKNDDLIVLTVNLGEDSSTVKKFIDKSNYHFMVLLDSKQAVAEQYNIASIPTSYFIDPEGKIAARRIGSMTEKQMEEYIGKLIN